MTHDLEAHSRIEVLHKRIADLDDRVAALEHPNPRASVVVPASVEAFAERWGDEHRDICAREVLALMAREKGSGAAPGRASQSATIPAPDSAPEPVTPAQYCHRCGEVTFPAGVLTAASDKLSAEVLAVATEMEEWAKQANNRTGIVLVAPEFLVQHAARLRAAMGAK